MSSIPNCTICVNKKVQGFYIFYKKHSSKRAIRESPANAAQADRPGGRSLRCWLESAKKSPPITRIKRDNFAVRRGAGASTVLVYGLAPATRYYTKLAFLNYNQRKNCNKKAPGWVLFYYNISGSASIRILIKDSNSITLTESKPVFGKL